MIRQQLLLVAPESAAADLGPLISAYANTGVDLQLRTYTATVPDTAMLTRWVTAAHGLDAILYLSPPRRSPRTLIDDPFVTTADGRLLPVGLYPLREANSIDRLAKLLTECRGRSGEQLAVGLLAQRHPRYQRLVDRMAWSLPEDAAPLRWTSSDLIREEMIGRLKTGLGLSIYFGHGRPVGWVGYYGLRAGHFTEQSGVPLGALLNLCCLTASRRRVGYAFAERLVTEGQAAATFGAVIPTRHTDNTRWAVRLAKVLNEENAPDNLGDLLARACPPQSTARRPYRIIGDPLAPILTEVSVITSLTEKADATNAYRVQPPKSLV